MRYLFIVKMFFFLLLGNEVFSQSWVSLDNSKPGEGYTITMLKSDVTSHQVKVKIHGFYDYQVTKDNVDYHRLYMGKGMATLRIGEPQLPTIIQRIAIPEGATYKVSINEEKWFDIKMGKIYPSQQDYKETEKEPKFQILDSIYMQEYNPSVIQLGEEQVWHNIRNVGISICPFKYNPVQNILSVLTDFVLEVDFFNVSDKSNIRSDAIYDALKWSVFDNRINDFLANISTKEEIKSFSSNDYDFLIIVGNIPSIYNSQTLKDFQKWKAFKGYKTKVVSTSTIGSTPESIKSFIEQEYYNNNICYVLFIGDDDKIPLKNLYYGGASVGSDYWYGCFNSGSDYQASIPIGRFSTNSLSDFQNMIGKTINYERLFDGNYQKTLLVAHKENAPQKYQGCCEDIRTYPYSTTLDFSTAYGASSAPNIGGNNATNSQVVNYINNGMHIVNYRGHGQEWHWGIYNNRWNTNNELFEGTQVNNLNKCSLFFNVCCQTGSIDEEPCMLESLTRSSHGAIACLAATEDTYTTANHDYDKSLFNNLFNNNRWNLGYLNLFSHADAILSQSTSARYNALASICGGDPTLEIWTRNPIAFTNISLEKVNGNIIVSSPPFNSGEIISVVSENGDLLNKYSISSSSYTFIAPSGNFYIVVNRHNYYPHITYCSSSGYIQNETLTGNSFYSASPLKIGYDVTTEKPYGNVVLKSGAKLSIQKGVSGVTIKNGFECELGGELIIE